LSNWFEDVTAQSIEPPLIETGHPESPTTLLPSHEAKLSGTTEFKGGWGWANDYVINWKNKGDQINWTVDVVNKGTHEIFVQYNCSEEFTLPEFMVNAGSNSNVSKIAEASDLETIHSPDRIKRGEVYEKKWSSMSLGTFELEEGENEISLTLNESMIEGWLEVKEVVIQQL